MIDHRSLKCKYNMMKRLLQTWKKYIIRCLNYYNEDFEWSEISNLIVGLVAGGVAPCGQRDIPGFYIR